MLANFIIIYHVRGFAPASSSSSTHATCPISVAHLNAVCPLSFSTSTPSWKLNTARRHRSWPCWAARCANVLPWVSRTYIRVVYFSSHVYELINCVQYIYYFKYINIQSNIYPQRERAEVKKERDKRETQVYIHITVRSARDTIKKANNLACPFATT